MEGETEKGPALWTRPFVVLTLAQALALAVFAAWRMAQRRAQMHMAR